MKVLKLAFSGELRVGKDTAADYVKTRKYPKLGYVHSESIAFAAPLYAILWYACDLLGFERTKNRNFLQSVGDWARGVDIDIFVKHLLAQVDRIVADQPSRLLLVATWLQRILALECLVYFAWCLLTSAYITSLAGWWCLTAAVLVKSVAEHYQPAALLIIVTDVRMKNEAKALKESGFR